MSHAHDSFLALVGAWSAMLAAMMLPLTWPWLRALHRLSAGHRSPGRLLAPGFGAGYLLVWLAFSVGAAAVQVALVRVVSPGPLFAGGALIAAGLYQLTPLKSACLEHCRSPLAVLLTRWPIGLRGALRLGALHGLVCLGCCWALMVLCLATGWGGWIWMSLLTALIAAEKLTRIGARAARWTGAGLVGLGVLSLLGI